jgi:hypothetical protein
VVVVLCFRDAAGLERGMGGAVAEEFWNHG